MFSSNLIDSNKKIDEQLNKLRECKAEMIKMFHDIDNLIDSPRNSFYYCSRSSFSKSNSKLYDITSSESSYLNSDSEHESFFYEPLEYQNSYRRPSLKFSFKFPLETEYDNISTYSSFAPKHGQNYNYDQYARTNSSRSPTKHRNRSLSSLNHSKSQTNLRQATWKPVGRVMSKSAVFSSSHDFSKSRKKYKNDSKDIGKGWKPTIGKSKEDLRIYSSSNYERDPFKNVTVKKKIVSDPKDIGQGWKNILAKPKDNLNIYARPVPEKEPFKTVVVKKRVVVDPRDIRKNEVVKKKNYTSFHSNDYEREPFRSVTVKRKMLKDEKDVGAGWKPVCVKSKDDFKMLYQKPIVTEKKTDANKNVNSGKEWKPSGKVKPDNPYKSDEIVRLGEKNINEKKNFKDNKNVGKDWKPNGKVKPDNPYKSDEGKVSAIKSKIKKESNVDSKPPIARKFDNKSKLDLDLKHIDEVKNDDDIYKTSTPNVSKKVEDNDLQESVILDEHGDNLVENKFEDESNLDMENSQVDDTKKSFEKELHNESIRNSSKKSNLDSNNSEVNQSKKSQQNEKDLEEFNESVNSKNSNIQSETKQNSIENNELEQSKKSAEDVKINDEIVESEKLNLEEEMKNENEMNELETSVNDETIKKSELIEEIANEMDDKSEKKEDTEVEETLKNNESSKVIVDADDNRDDDNNEQLNEQNDAEKENQLWKFQDSDEE